MRAVVIDFTLKRSPETSDTGALAAVMGGAAGQERRGGDHPGRRPGHPAENPVPAPPS